jgi:polar amino acid transport system permease protein
MKLEFDSLLRFWPDLLNGILLTIELSVLSTILGFILGTLCAIGSTSRNKFCRTLISIYVEVIRNTPLLVQIFIVYFGLATYGLKISPNVAAVIALVINIGAYTSEIVRAGIEATHKGQIEAAVCLGLNKWQILRKIILLQGIEKVYPALSSQFILLMLATSITSQIAAEELTAVANRVQSETYRSFEVFIVAGICYLLLAMLMRAILWGIGLMFFKRKRQIGAVL